MTSRLPPTFPLTRKRSFSHWRIGRRSTIESLGVIFVIPGLQIQNVPLTIQMPTDTLSNRSGKMESLAIARKRRDRSCDLSTTDQFATKSCRDPDTGGCRISEIRSQKHHREGSLQRRKTPTSFPSTFTRLGGICSRGDGDACIDSARLDDSTCSRRCHIPQISGAHSPPTTG